MNLFKSLIFLLFLSSCVEVSFKNPQPSKGKNLAEIPQEMIAFYSDTKEDSISENINGLKIKDYYNDKDFENSLSESIILKKWKGKYFLNQKEDNLWQLIMIVPISNNKFEIYQLNGGNEETIKLLKDITEVEEIYSKDGELESVILDPTNSEFKKIIKSGAFEKIDIF